MKAGLVYDPIYLKHNTGDHEENSQKLVAAMSHLKETGIEEKLIIKALKTKIQYKMSNRAIG
jgi:hypothetical protein